jgi:arylsulfatase A-like enzyme
VLLIITDDQGYGDFSIHGNTHLQRPNIDKLGNTGVRFDRFYVNSFCAPTRAALLTGRWPLRTGWREDLQCRYERWQSQRA